jgi:hypothetical protein
MSAMNRPMRFDDFITTPALINFAIALVLGMISMWLVGYLWTGNPFKVTTALRQRIANRLAEMRARRSNRTNYR